jgi:predicted Zn-dependent peptidase
MSWTYYEKADERTYCATLPNGLTVKVVPKTGFTKSLAYFVTDFGSIHRDFRLDGQVYHTPAGVAHFLEHKMFELPGRDVSAEFAALGGNVNAFTSFDMTAYYFSCTANFRENLKLLLEFVSTPYFTEESVNREYGIIDQEIAMNEDAPESREFGALMQKMYQNHPVREEILGTRDSIRQITAETLYTCHRAFYTPANMILCVVGDVDAEEVVALAREVLGDDYRAPAQKIKNWPEEMSCDTVPARLQLEVAMPTFQMGFKCEPAGRAEAALRTDVIGYLAAEMLFGESSDLYLELYEKGIIDTSFGGSFETIDGCAMLTCGGDSDSAEEIYEAVLDKAADLVQNGLQEAQFLRLKRGAMGRRIRDLDSFEAICFRQCAYHFLGFDYFHFPAIYADVTMEEVQAFLSRVVTKERCALATTHPTCEEG